MRVSRQAMWCGLGGLCVGILGAVGYVTVTSTATSPFRYLDPGALFVHNQDLLVRFQPLRQSLIATYTDHPQFHVGLYFEYLPTGANIVVNNDRAMWPASLIKIPVAMAVMKKIERGEWQLSNELVIMDEDKDSTFGDLYKEPSGTTLSIESLLRATLIDSDNTAHFVLLRSLDAEELEDVFFHLGLDEVLESLKTSPDATATDNRLTAKVYSTFFRSLYNASYLSVDNSETFLGFLEQSRREYVRLAIPAEIPFAHKTGVRAEEGVWADSGIVYVDRRPYLLTVMLEAKDLKAMPTDADVQTAFSAISKEVYTYVSSLE